MGNLKLKISEAMIQKEMAARRRIANEAR